jgi:regulator of sigma E protease
MANIFENIMMFVLGLFGLSFLVFIHELGHFLVAKKCGVRVNTFSIGFGKKLIKFRKGETEYCISVIPFGGYVAMAGEDPEDGKEGEELGPDAFVAKSVGVRAAIAFAGPFVNILFAFLLLIGLYLKGVEEADSERLVVGFVAQGSSAELAGVLPGDTIFELDGKPTLGWDDFRERVGIRLGAKVPFRILREGDTLSLTMVPQEMTIPSDDSLGKPIEMGVGDAGIYPRHRVVVRETPLSSTSAFIAGIQKGDTILEVNHRHITKYEDVVDIINGSNGGDLFFMLRRGNDTLLTSAQAKYNEEYKRYMVGINMTYVMFKETHLVQRNLPDATLKACGTSWKMTTSIFRYFKRMAQRQVKADAFSGPLTIVAVMGKVWMNGFDQFLMILALISINLGVMNLLPLAITDGGLLMFLALEKLRGHPVSRNKQLIIQKIAFAFFISFFVFITFLDFGKIGLFLK